MVLNGEDLATLRRELGFDSVLRRVFDLIPTGCALGYYQIGQRSGVTGVALDRALARLGELGAVERRRQTNVVIGDNLYYLRLVDA